jgi:hypothetical protein
MKQLTLDSEVRATTEQVSAELGDSTAILNLETATYFGVGFVGARVWELLQEPRIVSEVKQILLQEYEIGDEECERDLLDFLTSLMEQGLIRMAG